MASWMIHLRVAQGIYERINLECMEEFIMGNIAPDSGVPTADGKGFIPDAEISHFRTIDESGIKDVHENRYIEKYLTETQRAKYDAKAYSFYFGYLTHLLTDKLWASEIVYKAKEKYAELYENDRECFWKKIKRDWYDLDFMYLKNNPQFEAYRIYEGIGAFQNIYLDFFAEDAFEKRKQYITEFYSKGVQAVTEHETYLEMTELDDFVEFAIEEIMSRTSIYRKEIDKKKLLFYDAYEAFYAMAGKSKAFQNYCKNAFGADFSQDGFSDISQIDRILQYIPSENNVHILDIGCGNGKMLGYLQQKTGAYIHGFDYSEQAITTARTLFPTNSEFQEGIIGEINYPEASFDVITSMDTMYFAKDMTAFVAQVKKWLKPDGVFFVGYQEGDVMPKTESMFTTELTKALSQNGMDYEVTDITKQTYDLLMQKREAALAHRAEFEAEGYDEWFAMLQGQTECVTEPYEEFQKKMARYIYVGFKDNRG